MSVFPKHIIKGDNVVIHTKVDNYSLISLPVKLNLLIINKSGNFKKWIVKNKDYIVPPSQNNKSSFIERYFIVNTNRNMPLGKYVCLLSIDYLNKTEKSLTRKNAFFYIEEIKIIRKSSKLFIKNMSKLGVKVEIFYIGKFYTKELKSLEIFEIDSDNFLYLIYGNNNILF